MYLHVCFPRRNEAALPACQTRDLRPLSVITDVKSDLRGAGGREIKGAH